MTGTLKTQIDRLRWALLGEDEKNEMKKTGVLPGTRPYTAEQEIQADRVALELMSRGDYPMEALVEVWHRLVEVEHGRLLLWRFHAPGQERQTVVQDSLTQARGRNRVGEREPGS